MMVAGAVVLGIMVLRLQLHLDFDPLGDEELMNLCLRVIRYGVLDLRGVCWCYPPRGVDVLAKLSASSGWVVPTASKDRGAPPTDLSSPTSWFRHP